MGQKVEYRQFVALLDQDNPSNSCNSPWPNQRGLTLYLTLPRLEVSFNPIKCKCLEPVLQDTACALAKALGLCDCYALLTFRSRSAPLVWVDSGCSVCKAPPWMVLAKFVLALGGLSASAGQATKASKPAGSLKVWWLMFFVAVQKWLNNSAILLCDDAFQRFCSVKVLYERINAVSVIKLVCTLMRMTIALHKNFREGSLQETVLEAACNRSSSSPCLCDKVRLSRLRLWMDYLRLSINNQPLIINQQIANR